MWDCAEAPLFRENPDGRAVELPHAVTSFRGEAPEQAEGRVEGFPPPRAAGHRQPVRSLHVLVVEDNPINQLVAARMLEKLGHTCVLAANGGEALQAIASASFDMVLMDIQMPEMDGFEATYRIREQELRNGGHLPIIAMTASAIQGDRERFLNAGMDGYVPKPVRIPQLQEAMVDAWWVGGGRCG